MENRASASDLLGVELVDVDEVLNGGSEDDGGGGGGEDPPKSECHSTKQRNRKHNAIPYDRYSIIGKFVFRVNKIVIIFYFDTPVILRKLSFYLFKRINFYH